MADTKSAVEDEEFKETKVFITPLDTKATIIKRLIIREETAYIYVKNVSVDTGEIRYINIIKLYDGKIKEGVIKFVYDKSWGFPRSEMVDLWTVRLYIEYGDDEFTFNAIYSNFIETNKLKEDSISSIEGFVMNITNSDEKTVEKAEREIRNLTTFNDIKKHGKEGKFVTDKNVIYYKFPTTDDVYEIFDSMKVSNNIPLLEVGGYYKIYTNLNRSFNQFNEEKERKYIDDSNKRLTIYIRSRKPSSNVFDEKYLSIAEMETDGKYATLKIAMKLGPDMDSKKLINIVENSLGVNSGTLKKDLNGPMNGSYTISNAYFNPYILYFLLMNRQELSMFFYSIELESSTKKRMNIYIYNLFKRPITISITSNITSDGNDVSTTLNAVVKEVRPENLHLIQSMIGKLITYYNNEEKSVIQFYTPYLSKKEMKGLEMPTPGKGKKGRSAGYLNHDLAPDLYIVGVPRQCGPQATMINARDVSNEDANWEKRPTWVTDWEIKNLPGVHGVKSILYPKDKISGQPQFWYGCNSKEGHVYPGLKLNKARNNEMYPYIPCCYKKDQNNKPDMKQYYENVTIQTGKRSHEAELKSDKLLIRNQRGEIIPNSIKSLLKLITVGLDRDNVFIRYGVKRSVNSFIECVIRAVDIKERRSVGEKNINLDRKVLAVRKESEKLINVCRQEMYNINDPVEYIKDEANYYDPRYLYRAMEEMFNINIIMFTSHRINNKDGTFLKPNFTGGYIRRKLNMDLDTIFIYEHVGAESDKNDDYQCNLLVYDKKFFIPKDIVNRVEKYYSDYIDGYRLGTKPIEKLLKFKNARAQYIDSYGKTRILSFDSGKVLFTDALPPFNLPLLDIKNIGYFTEKEAMECVLESDANIISQSVYGNVLTSLNVLMRGNMVYIPIVPSEYIHNIPIDKRNYIPYPEKKSITKRWNENKKMSGRLIETATWLFSKYINDNKISFSSYRDFIDKANKFFIPSKHIEINTISKNFETNSLISNGKLLFLKEWKDGVVYNVLLEYFRKHKAFMKYAETNLMRDYYNRAEEFKPGSNFKIVHGFDSMKQYFEQGNALFLHKIPDNNVFFKNEFVEEGSIVLLLYTGPSESYAAKISDIWHTNGYIKFPIADDIKNDDDLTIPLRTYDFINSFTVTGEQSESDNKGIILRYKDDVYACLLI